MRTTKRKTTDVDHTGAGVIGKEWLAGARCNGTDSDIADWFELAAGARIDLCGGGSEICAWDRDAGRWLTQHDIDELCLRIDNGV